MIKRKKSGKYNHTKTKCLHGHTHDSAAEAGRCNDLHRMMANGLISDLQIQVRFEIIPKFTKSGEMTSERSTSYVADFVYLEESTKIIEDVKSEATKKDNLYIIKRKLMKSIYCYRGSGCVFREVTV